MGWPWWVFCHLVGAGGMVVEEVDVFGGYPWSGRHFFGVVMGVYRVTEYRIVYGTRALYD